MPSQRGTSAGRPDPSIPERPRGVPSAMLNIVDQAPASHERADAARNRKRILDAARKLLGRRAMKDICMDELAKAAGVGKGTLYRRFVDRSSLCLALLDDNERLLQERVLRGFDLPPGTSAWKRLTTLIDGLFDFVIDNSALLAEAEASHQGAGQRFDHPTVHWRRAELSRLMRLASDEGSMRPVAHLELMADLILNAIDPQWVLHQLEHGVEERVVREAFARLWRQGLAGL